MNAPDETGSAILESKALLLLLAVTTVAFGWILLPFYGTILWGAIIALLFSPVNRWLLRRKWHRTQAALLTLLLVLFIVILPFALVTVSLASEANLLYERMQSGELNPLLYFRGVFAALPDWISSLLDRFGLTNFDVLQRRLSAALLQASQFFGKQALSIGQSTFDFVAALFITLYLAFFLIRDGDVVVNAVQHALPLSSTYKQKLLDKFIAVIRATVKGNLLVAAIQGGLGGLAFWFLDIPGAVLWAVLMAFMSLLPAIGAGLVWLPVAFFFLMAGMLWKGFALMLYGVLVIGLVDNLLRPLLVGRDTRMPDYVVMISTLGGMSVLGINGFVVGPVIAAMFIAAWDIYTASRSGDLS